MAERRLTTIQNHLQNQFTKADLKSSFVSDALQYLKLTELFPPNAERLRQTVRQWAQSEEVEMMIRTHTEAATFPKELPKILAGMGLFGTKSGEYCRKLDKWDVMSIFFELARKDLSLATFYMVQTCVGMDVIDMLGSPEQKAKYLPKIQEQDLKVAFALAEPDFGSDATSMDTTATPVEGGFRINGIKKWPSAAAQADILLVFARNTTTQQIQGFIVSVKSPGVKIDIIQHKLSLRIIQNGIITLKNVFVPSEEQMPGAKDFQSGVNKVLTYSRIGVSFASAGMAAGTYDICVKYLRERVQFKLPLGSFQLQQERLVRILSNFNAMFLNSYRLIQLATSGQPITAGQVGLVKSWNTKMLRETVALGREMFGGNGIISDFEIIRKFVDAEAAHTYEGSYDVNVLVAGRDLTGISAIAPKSKK